nr:DUF805 domain-containing protein [Sedimenticola hydrogenitrophicus]
MDTTNPYQTPAATVEPADIQTYQPRIIAVSGRIGRLRYIAYGTGLMLLSNLLFVFLGTLSGISGSVGIASVTGGYGLLLILLYLFLFAIAIIYAKRRLNDLNHTGLLSLLLIVPVGNILLALYLLFGRGTRGANRYGPAPCGNSIGVKILGLMIPVVMVVGILAAIAIPAYQQYLQRATVMQQQ